MIRHRQWGAPELHEEPLEMQRPPLPQIVFTGSPTQAASLQDPHASLAVVRGAGEKMGRSAPSQAGVAGESAAGG